MMSFRRLDAATFVLPQALISGVSCVPSITAGIDEGLDGWPGIPTKGAYYLNSVG